MDTKCAHRCRLTRTHPLWTSGLGRSARTLAVSPDPTTARVRHGHLCGHGAQGLSGEGPDGVGSPHPRCQDTRRSGTFSRAPGTFLLTCATKMSSQPCAPAQPTYSSVVPIAGADVQAFQLPPGRGPSAHASVCGSDAPAWEDVWEMAPGPLVLSLGCQSPPSPEPSVVLCPPRFLALTCGAPVL